MKYLKNLLNQLTMYKIVLYSLLVIIGWSVVLAVLGVYKVNLLGMVASLLVVVIAAWSFNSLFAKLFRIEPNSESYLISSLILFLIFSPAGNLVELGWLILVMLAAMASKYLLVIRGKHLFNPVAFGAFVIGLGGITSASWWVSTPWMMPVVAITGALVVWKLKKLAMVGIFFVVGIAMSLIANWQIIHNPLNFVYEMFSSWPLLFFGLFMFSEPSTTPGRFYQQWIYGGLVGVLFAIKFSFGPIYSTPELVLLIGNVFSFIVSNRRGLKLRLKSHKEVASTIYEFRFDRGDFSFQPGQYLEWTLRHQKADLRGNRRYFTIASSPSEKELIIATKMSENSSSFKSALMAMKVGDLIQATNLAGDFVMDESAKQVWIAGGIGITPFRSMAKYFIDEKKLSDIVLFYACNSLQEMAYRELFESAASVGVKIVEVVKDQTSVPAKWNGEIGYVTEAMIKKYVADWQSRKYYMSGPSMMVENYSKMLKGMGIKSSQIVTDFFPGY